jgi:pimeloyl-ACP methyl ester carboxylesterase
MATEILRTAPERFALAGISMGGYICFEIMRQAPHRVARLALLGTSARPDTPQQAARRRTALSEAKESNFADFAEQIFTRALHPENRGDPRLRRLNRAMAQTVSYDDFERNTHAAIQRGDARGGLADIAIPTVVAVGDSDDITPVAHAKEIADAIAAASLHIIARAGHAATVEQPDAVNAVLQAWAALPG